MKKWITLIIALLMMLQTKIFVYAEDIGYEDGLKLLSSTVRDGDTTAPPAIDELNFVFNHRIDPCDNNFSLFTFEELIESWQIRANNVRIKLKKPLDYDTDYLLRLDGLSDLYGNEYADKSVGFKTGFFEILSQRFYDGDSNTISAPDKICTTYCAEYVNHSAQEKSFWVVMTASGGCDFDLSIEKLTIPQGGKADVRLLINNLGDSADSCIVKVFYLQSLETAQPFNKNYVPMSILKR